jgi:MFS family permease
MSSRVDSAPAMGRNFRVLALATAVSNIGDGITVGAMPLLALTLSSDPRVVAGVAVASGLPWVIASIPAGALVDATNNRRLMILIDSVRAAVIACIGVLAAAGALQIPLLYAGVFLLGTGQVVFGSAYQTILPDIVAARRLERGNGVLNTVEMVAARFAGPAAGATLFVIHPALPFLVDAGSFLLGVVLLRLMTVSNVVADSQAGSSRLRPMFDGFRWLRRHPFMLGLGSIVAVINLIFTAGNSVLVVLATTRLDLPRADYGLLIAAGALGGALGGLSASTITKRLGHGCLLVIGLIISGAADLTISSTTRPVLAGVALAVSGFAGAAWNVANVSMRQRYVPRPVLGRVSSVLRFLSWGAIPLGALVGGQIAHTWSPAACYLMSGVGMLLLLVPLALMIRSPQFQVATKNDDS